MKIGRDYFDQLVERRDTHSYKWDSHPAEGLIPMWVADMDFKTAPPIIDALRHRVEHGIFGYVTVPDTYYQATIDWFSRRHGWNIERSWIQYTTGVVPALSVIIKAFTSPGDRVLVLTPVYNCFFSSIRNNGCRMVEIRLNYVDGGYHIDFDDLECKAKQNGVKLLLFCNPHNPGGRVWTRDEMARVGDICKRNGVVVVSDEIHCELVFAGHKYVPMASIEGCQDNTITCISPTKSFNIAGLQIANIVCNNPEWRALIDRAININEVCDVNPFGVEALIAAYTRGEPWLEAMCDYVYANYQLLRDTFAARLPHFEVARLEGTYLAWIKCPSKGCLHSVEGRSLSDSVTQLLLDEARVMVSSGTLYGDAGEGFIRVNLACPRMRLDEAMGRLVPVLQAAFPA